MMQPVKVPTSNCKRVPESSEGADFFISVRSCDGVGGRCWQGCRCGWCLQEMQVHNYQSLSLVSLPGMVLLTAHTQDHAVES